MESIEKSAVTTVLAARPWIATTPPPIAVSRLFASLCVALTLAGCAQPPASCEPGLQSVSAVARFPGELTQENRSVAQTALEDMGFAPSYAGGMLEMSRFQTIVLVAGDGRYTRWRYDFEIRENFPSAAEASRAADAHVPDTWTAFNRTLDDFENRTGWTSSHRGKPGPVVTHCI